MKNTISRLVLLLALLCSPASAQIVFAPPANTGSIENRIINGDMMIDQRNVGATVTVSAPSVDRWAFTLLSVGALSVARSTDAPAGFLNSVLATVVSKTDPGAGTNANRLDQAVEGQSVADLNLGTANAKTIMLSFWAKASVAGNYSVYLQNSARDRSYVRIVPLTSTWTYYSLAIPGDTSGTWLTGAGVVGLRVGFDYGTGTTRQTASVGAWLAGYFSEISGAVQMSNQVNGSTMNLANVRARAGTFDVPYIARPFGTEFALAQRYYFKTFPYAVAPAQNAGVGGASCTKNPIALGDPAASIFFPVTMDKAPTIVTRNPSATNDNWRDVTAGADVTVSVDPGATTGTGSILLATTGTVTTLGDVLCIHLTADAEL